MNVTQRRRHVARERLIVLPSPTFWEQCQTLTPSLKGVLGCFELTAANATILIFLIVVSAFLSNAQLISRFSLSAYCLSAKFGRSRSRAGGRA